MNLNKVSLIGYLESNPTSRTLPSGRKLVGITVVTAEDTSPIATDAEILTAVPHEVVAYGRLGEIMLKYLKVGDRVYVEGKLQKKRPQKPTHGKSETVIVALQLIMLGGRSKARQQTQSTE